MESRYEGLGLLQRTLADGARVVVSRHGGQVLSWVAGGRERLYLSRCSAVDGQQPVRGGVPVCFPQFSGRGPLPKHGFARTRRWTELPAEEAGRIHLRLVEDAASLRLWPHRFELDLHVTLQPAALEMRIDVRNTGDEPWTFTGALHTYLRIEEVGSTRLRGLQGLRVEDTLRPATFTVVEDSPDLSRPIDSIYQDIGEPLELLTPDGALCIEQAGFTDAVVWNPGEAGAATLEDVRAGDWRRFLCVEAAQVQRPILLEPGQSWTGSQRLHLP